jgi:hypothetical protein
MSRKATDANTLKIIYKKKDLNLKSMCRLVGSKHS